MKEGITYIAREKFDALIANSGLSTSDKSGWTRVDGQSGRRLYVPKTKRVGRVDLVGLEGAGTIALGGESHGAVTHQLDMTGTEEEVLAAFEGFLGQLGTLEAVAKPAKEAKAPKEPKAAKAAPTQSRKDRLQKIRQVAAQMGVPVAAGAEIALADSDEDEAAIEELASAE